MYENFNISPVNTSKKLIPVVFSFNNKYCKYFSVILNSILENSRNDCFYDIIALCSDLSSRNKKLLNSMLKENISLRFYDVSPLAKSVFEAFNLTTTKNWSIDTYYRIFIPIIMKDYEKALYADCDVIFNKDFTPIFDIDFENKKLLAVPDNTNFLLHLKAYRERKLYNERQIGLKDGKNYFNSGMLVFNIAKIDTNQYIKQIKNAFSHLTTLKAPDQDLLNYIFKDSRKLISRKWNLQYILSNIKEKDLPAIDKDAYNEYRQSYNNPIIIHYAGQKPWYYPENDLAEVFWKYARTTVFYEEILHQMYRNEIYEARYATNLYSKIQNEKKYLFWGASVFLENFIKNYEINSETQNNILGIIDSDLDKINTFLGGFKVLPPPSYIRRYQC